MVAELTAIKEKLFEDESDQGRRRQMKGNECLGEKGTMKTCGKKDDMGSRKKRWHREGRKEDIVTVMKKTSLAIFK